MFSKLFAWLVNGWEWFVPSSTNSNTKSLPTPGFKECAYVFQVTGTCIDHRQGGWNILEKPPVLKSRCLLKVVASETLIKFRRVYIPSRYRPSSCLSHPLPVRKGIWVVRRRTDNSSALLVGRWMSTTESKLVDITLSLGSNSKKDSSSAGSKRSRNSSTILYLESSPRDHSSWMLRQTLYVSSADAPRNPSTTLRQPEE